jgi:replicative DNA helicase
MTAFSTTARPRPFGISDDAAQPLIERMPPHDLSAEAGVLGSMIIEPACVGNVCAVLRTGRVFFKEENQVIFDVKVLANAVPIAAHAEYYAAIVKEKAIVRGIISAATATLRDCYESGDNAAEISDRFEQRASQVSADKTTGVPQKLGDILHETFERDGQAGDEGFDTGLIELDNVVRLYRGHMMLLGARPSHGKTAMAMGFVEHLSVDCGKPSAVFSLEMSKKQLSTRMLCGRSGVGWRRLNGGQLSSDERDRVVHATGQLHAAPIFIDDTAGQTLFDIRSKARRLKKEEGIELIVIDYVQLIEGAEGENRQQQISATSRGIKHLARELNIPTVALSQLNRLSESQDRMPRTSDLRESGSLEQDADEVVLLYRHAVAHRGDDEWANNNPDKINEALAIVAKQRDGPCENVKLNYIADRTRFVTYQPGA